MNQPLNIVVTGTSRGIGAAIRGALTAHNVVGHSTRGGDVAVAADFADPDQVTAFWWEAMGRLDGRVDVLVNNAGIFEATAIEQRDEDWLAGWERTMRVNLTASAALCRLGVLHFREHGGGRIVNVASRAAYRGDSPAHWHYAASKAGMIGMTKTIARG
ncbi:MAG TPA: SDR family oxidoreductase, partial [Allosphingosinicella sp.]